MSKYKKALNISLRCIVELQSHDIFSVTSVIIFYIFCFVSLDYAFIYDTFLNNVPLLVLAPISTSFNNISYFPLAL